MISVQCPAEVVDVAEYSCYTRPLLKSKKVLTIWLKYENTKDYPCGKFRRMCGMKRKTFEKTVEILNAKYVVEHAKNVRKSGWKPKLCMEDKLLATFFLCVGV